MPFLPEVVDLLRATVEMNLGLLEHLQATAEARGEHPDWPWLALVMSGATRGGSARWNVVQPRYDDEFAWAALLNATDQDRLETLRSVGRFKNRTAAWLNAAYLKFLELGGPEQVRHALADRTAANILSFWRGFTGIGDKYARNIMMDVYHPQFRTQFFAVDSRIIGLLSDLGYEGPPRYSSREQFLLGLAGEVGCDAWDLDRTLYTEADYILRRLIVHRGEFHRLGY